MQGAGYGAVHVHDRRESAVVSYSAVVVLSVTVVPCDHFEWQPPQISAENMSWSVGLIVRTREPESSAALKMAPQTLHGSSRSSRRCLRESVGVFIRSVYRFARAGTRSRFV